MAAQEDVAPTSLPSVNQHQWRPPEQDHFKVNFDAALFQSLNLAGIGVVIRDWRGDVVAALSMPTALASSVADLEVLACRRALLFAAEKELQKVIFEGDSVSVMNAVWANFALGSNSVKGKARPNISCEGIQTSEDDQPRNG